MKRLKDKVSGLSATVATHEKVGFLRLKVWPALEKFLIAGPTLVGFILGIWRYAPGQEAFETGFQSLIIFLGYIAVFTFLQILDSVFFASWPIILGVGRSLLALAYLTLTLRQYYEWRTGTPHFYALTKKCRSRLTQVTGNAF
jgi:hypothetical protein